MTFTELPVERANRLINHGPIVLVTSKYREKANIMTAAWCMPASHKPPKGRKQGVASSLLTKQIWGYRGSVQGW